ncbi:uncharacterized protein LOC134269195 [Saccostrea cucullata]|uniref:uncharacterized protein LOC134269195 n=1 Tax=Saccostrea cuccullata TaxID=36930 RepID=UPI002ED1102A
MFQKKNLASFGVQDYTPTIVTDEWVNGTTLQIPTNITNVPSVTGVYDQTIHLPQQSVHGVSSNCYYNGVHSPVVTPTPNVTTPGPSAEYPQRSSAKLKSWSLQPQSVPAFVAPVEAQTKSKPKKSKEKIPKTVSQGQYVSADKNLTSKSSMAKGSRKLEKNNAKPMQQSVGKPVDVTLHQTENSVQTSLAQKGGKKGVKRIVVPPKAQTDSVEYPPYVARIMRILNRQKQGQVESADDKKETESDVFTSKQMTSVGKKDTGRSDSTPKQATTATVQKATNTVDSSPKKATDTMDSSPKRGVVARTPVSSKQSVLEMKFQQKSLSSSAERKVIEKCSQLKYGSKQEPMSIKKTLPEDYKPVVNTALLLDDWSPDSFTLLEADSFYGPEILVTSGSHCFVASVPFF